MVQRSKWPLRNMTAVTVSLVSLSPSAPRRALPSEIRGGGVVAAFPHVSPYCISTSRVKRIITSFRASHAFPRTVAAFGVNLNSSSSAKDGGESSFLNDSDVVDDMEDYLNHLSLEYDSVWDTKPSWCQPWTISLTGMLAIASSWLILHSVAITAFVLFLICAWWYIFLYSYPKTYSEMIAERRKRVASGMEDTYGQSKGA